MQPITYSTQAWIPISSASPANEPPGEISPEAELALLDMANQEFEQYRLLPRASSVRRRAVFRTEESNTVSARRPSLQVARPDAAQITTSIATSSAAPTLSWLNADGSLNNALPDELLFQRVVESVSDPAIVTVFAEWLCENEFQQGDAGLISDQDAYGMSMSVRNEGNFLDPNLQHLAGEAMREFVETRHRWNDRIVARVNEQFEGIRSTAQDELPGALAELQLTAYRAMREEAMDILERCARTLVHSD